jgi:hypothetical protein
MNKYYVSRRLWLTHLRDIADGLNKDLMWMLERRAAFPEEIPRWSMIHRDYLADWISRQNSL